jgi:ubiquinone biosynthesis protein
VDPQNVPLYLVAALFTVVTVALFAWSVRGVLGVRFTLIRLLISGIIVFAVFGPIMNAIVKPDDLEQLDLFPGVWFFLLGLFLSLLTGMVFLVIAEALVPSNTLPGPIFAVQATRRWFRRGARYWRIARIILRHGLTAYLFGGRRAELGSPEGRSELARRLREALSEGGVTYVKLGQILSTRRDLLPREFVDELALLQHRAAPVLWPEIDLALRRELGEDYARHVARLDQEPLAAASIAQVHTAALVTGEEVVIKVRRPGIVSEVDRDLDIVRRLATTLHRSTTWGSRIGILDLADGFAAALREELDLTVEARNIAVVAAGVRARGDDASLHIPVVYPHLSSSRILVMERIDGIPLGVAGNAIAARNLDGDELARSLLNALLRQIVIDGTFHADPHPGNVMLLENGKLTLLDFGSVGRIDAVLRGALVRLILSFEHGDPIAAGDALLDLVERPDGLDEYRLERALGQFMARYLTPGVPPDVRMFADLFRIIARFGLSVPSEVAAVFRAIATLEGTLGTLSPGFNVVAEARAFASSYLAAQMRPSALRRTLTEELATLIPMMRRLPRRVDRIATALEEGRLNVNVRPLADERDQSTISRMLHEVLVTILASTAGVMGVTLLGRAGGPQLTDSVSAFQFMGYALLVGAMMLAMRVLVIIFRPGQR